MRLTDAKFLRVVNRALPPVVPPGKMRGYEVAAQWVQVLLAAVVVSAVGLWQLNCIHKMERDFNRKYFPNGVPTSRP